MTTPHIDQIRSKLSQKGDSFIEEGFLGQASVLVPLMIDQGEFALLLTRRSLTMRQHRGEVAFPGGMWELGEGFPTATALREAHEEIALEPDQVELLGILPAMSTGKGTQVTPVVGLIEPGLPLAPSPAEIDSIFYLPISYFIEDRRLRTDVFTRNGQPYWVPAYHFEGYEIWGFTAAVIKTLLSLCFDTALLREHSAPEKIW